MDVQSSMFMLCSVTWQLFNCSQTLTAAIMIAIYLPLSVASPACAVMIHAGSSRYRRSDYCQQSQNWYMSYKVIRWDSCCLQHYQRHLPQTSTNSLLYFLQAFNFSEPQNLFSFNSRFSSSVIYFLSLNEDWGWASACPWRPSFVTSKGI